MTHQQTDLLLRVAKALPAGNELPPFRFQGMEWEATNGTAIGYGASLEEALFCWIENAKSLAQEQMGEGYKWDAALKLLEPYAPPIDTTYPITFTETAL